MVQKPEIKWLIFFVTTVGGFLSMLDASSINIALYEISKAFGVKIVQVQWVVVAYMLVVTVLLPFFGKLNDIISRKYLYSAGYVIFSLGAVLNIASGSVGFLIFGRIVQAIGASILLSNSYAIISSVFKGEKRGKALGFAGAMIAFAGMTGPFVGGVMMHFFNWRFIFIPSVLLACFGAYFAYKFIPSIASSKKFQFDFKGLIFFVVSLFSMLLAITQGQSWGWGSKKVMLLGFLFVIFAVLFYFTETREKQPMIDFKLFKNRTFLFGNLAMMFSYLALFSNGILLPFYAQEILHKTPLVTGLLMVPFSLCLTVIAPFSGNLAGKKGSKIPTVTGSIIIVVALCVFTLFDENTKIIYIVLAQMLMGAGSGFYQSPANIAVMNSAPARAMGVSSGILALFRNVGMSTGVAIAISIFSFMKSCFVKSGLDYSAAFISSYHITLYFGIFFAFVCLLLSLLAYSTKEHPLKKLFLKIFVLKSGRS